jgi:amino acid permease
VRVSNKRQYYTTMSYNSIHNNNRRHDYGAIPEESSCRVDCDAQPLLLKATTKTDCSTVAATFPNSQRSVVTATNQKQLQRDGTAPPQETTTVVHNHNNEGTATVLSEVANMTKNMIGGGVLSLSAGIALYADTTSNAVTNNGTSAAAWTAVGWVTLLAGVFGYFCALIGKSCRMTRSKTYRECWERSVGERGGWTVAVVNTLDPLLGIFANASILSQSLQLLLRGNGIYWTVTECLLFCTVFALLPLCLLKNLKALAPFSALGMLAVLTALTVMVLRYLDGSYQPGGIYFDDTTAIHVDTQEQPTRQLTITTSHQPFFSSLPFVCMVYTAFDMHYNAPRFYAELHRPHENFTTVVVSSFGVAAIVYISIAVVGFWTFGANADSFILNNYSPLDPLATLSRLAIGVCSLLSYPLNFIGVRDNCLDIMGITDRVDTPGKLDVASIVLLSVLTLASCFVTDLGLINSVGGGTTVTLVCFLFPALMFRESVRKFGTGALAERIELWLVMSLMVVGIVIGIVGVGYSI